ncbi:DUF4157 domain-containing protein [Duganella sp.]|uniref:eCIS core domain-containing protein n=1 Tax=Duganella sp. TaxID=1904440 RepID=UPI0031E40755
MSKSVSANLASKATSAQRKSGKQQVAKKTSPLAALQSRAGNRATTRMVQGSGTPLAPSLRQEMEGRFGESFADVRIHDNTQAHASAASMNAKAYTHGKDIVFSAQRFNPSSTTGKQLLAHELAHVVQQRRGGSAPDPAHHSATETGARAAAQAVTGGSGPVSVSGASAVGVAREPEDEEEQQQKLPAMSVIMQKPKKAAAAPPAQKPALPKTSPSKKKVEKPNYNKARGSLAEVNVPFAAYAGPEWNHIAGGGETASSRVSVARMSEANVKYNTEATAGIDFIVENVKTGQLVLGEQKATNNGGEFRNATAITTYLEKNVDHAAKVLQQQIDDGKVKDPAESKRLQATVERLRKTHEALVAAREGKPAALPDGVTLELTSLGGEGSYIGPDFIKRLGRVYKKNPDFVEHLLSRTQTRVLKPGQTAPEVTKAMDGLSDKGHEELARVKAGKTQRQWDAMKRKEAARKKADEKAQATKERAEKRKQDAADRQKRIKKDKADVEKAGEKAKRARMKELETARKKKSDKEPSKTQLKKENTEGNKAAKAAKEKFTQDRDKKRAEESAKLKADADAQKASEAANAKAAADKRAEEAAARKAADDAHAKKMADAHKEVDAMGEMNPEKWGQLPKEQRQRLEALAAKDKALAAKLHEKVNARQTAEWNRYEATQRSKQTTPKVDLGKAAHRMNQGAAAIRAYDAYLDARDKGDSVPMALAKGGLTAAENLNPVIGAMGTMHSRMQTETLPDGRKQQVYGEDAGDAFFGTLGETIGGYIVPGAGWDQAINGAANLIGAGDDHLNRGKPPGDKATLRTGTDLVAEMTPSRMFSSTVGAGLRAYYDIGKAIGGQTSGVDKFAEDGLRGKLGAVIQPWAMAADFLGNLGGDSPGAALEKTIKRTEGSTLKKIGDATGDAMFELGQSKEAKAGKYGAPVQGISMALGMTSDMIAGKSFEQALGAAADAGKGSVLETVGSALGDAAFAGVEKGKELLDKDLPELKDKARQAYDDAKRSLTDWWHK